MVAESLLFELEIREETAEIPRYSTDLDALGAHVAVLMAPRTLFESRLLSDVRQFKAAVLEEEGQGDIVVLATKLAAVGYHVAIRTAMGGGAGQQCFRNLHHEFLIIGSEGEDLIVEPQFRAQFCICHATPEYKQLIQALPDEWVGSQGRVKPLVRLLCSQMALAFNATQAACPPWRQQSSVISKWLPTKKKDRSVSADPSTPHGGSSPTSTLTPPDSASIRALPASTAPKPWVRAAPTPSNPAVTAWQISTAVLLQQQHKPTAPAGESAKRPLLSPQSTAISPKPRSRPDARLEPSTSTKGFQVRARARPAAPLQAGLATPSQASDAGASRRGASLGPAEIATAMAERPVHVSSPPWPRADLERLRQLVPQGEGLPPDGGAGQDQARSLQAGPGPVHLGLVRRSAPALARSARFELLQQPPIHTVKLGRVQRAH